MSEELDYKVKGVGQECPTHTGMRIPLERMYDYRRMLPHYQKAGRRALFVTFCKLIPPPFTAEARDVILHHCLHDDGKRYLLHAAAVMPEHVHLLLSPLLDEKGWSCGLPAILKLIRGSSARSVNKLLGSSGPVWQEESFDHVLRSAREPGRKTGVHPAESSKKRPGKKAGRLPLALGRARPQMTRVGRTLLSDAFDFGGAPNRTQLPAMMPSLG